MRSPDPVKFMRKFGVSNSILSAERLNLRDPRGGIGGVSPLRVSAEGSNANLAILDMIGTVEWQQMVLKRIQAATEGRVRSNVEYLSRTLARDMKIYLRTSSKAQYGSSDFGITYTFPYYWAKYVLEGRGPVSPKSKKVLVFFGRARQKRDNDPRTKPHYARTVAEDRSFREFPGEWDRITETPEAKKTAGLVITSKPVRAHHPFPIWPETERLINAKAQEILNQVVKEATDALFSAVAAGLSGQGGPSLGAMGRGWGLPPRLGGLRSGGAFR